MVQDTLISSIFYSALAVALFFFIMWLMHLPMRNVAIVDVGWGLGFIVIAIIDIILGVGFNTRNLFLLMMVTLWGLRISVFVLKRILHERHEDKRYAKIREGFGPLAWLKFLIIFEFQAMLQVAMSVQLLIIARNPNTHVGACEMVGIVLFSLALIGETIADEQLRQFKANAENKAQVCNIGLWRYSRHPNYFFEWLIWVGLFIYGLSSPWGWLGIVAPAIMYWLLMYVSGVPMAEEQALKSRGEAYRRYQQETSIFFLMPVKKG